MSYTLDSMGYMLVMIMITVSNSLIVRLCKSVSYTLATNSPNAEHDKKGK